MTSGSERDVELDGWRAEWQSLGGKEAFAASLVDRAARDGAKMRRAAAREVLAAAFSTGVAMWLIVRTKGALEVVSVTGLIILFNGVWLAHFFTLRSGLFRGSGEGIDEFVALTRRRLATEQRFTRFALRSVGVISATLVPWAIWVFFAHREAYAAAPWRAIVGFGGAAAIFAGVTVFARRKATRLDAEAARFERQVAQAALE